MDKPRIRPIEILLVEDNEGDIILTQTAFEDAKIINNMHVARDGEEALAFLNQEGEFANVVKPDLILLDLNLPKLDGREVLDKVKNHESLRTIPVVVLSSSEAEQDIAKSYQLHANSYIVKPIDLDQFISVIEAVENFWFSVVTLPD